MTDYATLMTTFSLFEGYTARGTQTLIERGQIRACQPGDILYAKGTAAVSVALVLEGMVEHFISQHGREITLGTTGPSHVLADVSVLGGMEHPTSARVKDAAVVLEWDREAFGRLVGGDAVFAQRVIQQTAQSVTHPADQLDEPRVRRHAREVWIEAQIDQRA